MAVLTTRAHETPTTATRSGGKTESPSDVFDVESSERAKTIGRDAFHVCADRSNRQPLAALSTSASP